MDMTRNELTVEQKLDLIRGRAIRFGLKQHDLEDAVQDVMLYLLEFTPDPAKANGATESTILTGAIDLRLKQWLRSKQRYQDMVDRWGAMLPAEEELLADSGVEKSDAAIDVASLLADLPEFERRIGHMLSEGHTAYSIARELGIGRRAVNAAIDVIRERFSAAGFGGEEQA